MICEVIEEYDTFMTVSLNFIEGFCKTKHKIERDVMWGGVR